jgi:hypothetical protein
VEQNGLNVRTERVIVQYHINIDTDINIDIEIDELTPKN